MNDKHPPLSPKRMKDYYKILGVDKNVSEEEIRRHWIKLMQRYHPDCKGNENPNDQRIREINEAYEILKHSSTRMEYDLRRKAYQRKKRKSYLRSLPVPISILIILLIINTICFRKSHAPPASKYVSTEVNETSGRSETKKVDQRNQIDRRDRTGHAQRLETSMKPPQIVLKKVKAVRPKVFKEVKSSEGFRTKEVKIVPIAEGSEMASMPAAEAKPNPPIEKTSVGLSSKSGVPDKEKKAEGNRTDRVEEKNQREEEVTESEKPIQKKLIRIEEAKPPEQEIRIVPVSVSEKNDKADESDQIDQKDKRSQIATEEEVKQFFENYVDRYNRKDIDRFLSFFSMKAIQNHKDGFEKIKMMYTRFFNESQRLAYRLKDQKTGILSDHARVRASYEIERVDRAGGIRLWRGNAEWVLVKEGWDLKISSLQYQHDQGR